MQIVRQLALVGLALGHATAHMQVPSLTWDTHCHILDPTNFPFSPNRTYTPREATPAELLASSPGSSFLLVQASVENGRDGLLAHMKDIGSHLLGDNVVRGEIIFGEDTKLCEDELLQLHIAGVRVLRGYARTSNDSTATAEELRRLLKGPMGRIAREYGWMISFQMPPAVWTLLEDFPWHDELPGVPIIAEHLGSVNVPMDEESHRGLETLLKLMREEVLTVKINALHRRGLKGHEDEMMKVLSQLAKTAPHRLIWGSDWPHVNTTAPVSQTQPFLPVNATEELSWLQSFLPRRTYTDMVYSNPTRLFY